MAFTFGFGGDDIENDSDNDELAQQVANCTIDDVPLIPPKRHTLQNMLDSLPSQISYNLLPIPKQNRDYSSRPELIIPRRSMFDIQTQLMAEANPEENENETMLAGLERGDLTSGIYEGGFKTWECSLDLASLVADLRIEGDLKIIELGAGSAIPSLMALQIALERSTCPTINFTLCDYNEDVLRLATAPNVFLAGDLALRRHQPINPNDDLDIEDIDEGKVRQCTEAFINRSLSFEFISGAWGNEFLKLIQPPDPAPLSQTRSTLILASETIYSPNSTKIFVDTLMQLLRRDPINTKAWVAAKKIYFGVGGGVDDFVDQVKRHNGSVETLLDITGGGVGRVVLEVVARD